MIRWLGNKLWAYEILWDLSSRCISVVYPILHSPPGPLRWCRQIDVLVDEFDLHWSQNPLFTMPYVMSVVYTFNCWCCAKMEPILAHHCACRWPSTNSARPSAGTVLTSYFRPQWVNLPVLFSDSKLVPGQSGDSDEEEVLDLLYDPVLNCYFDPKTCKYYELTW